jgi:hypothetical protein
MGGHVGGDSVVERSILEPRAPTSVDLFRRVSVDHLKVHCNQVMSTKRFG